MIFSRSGIDETPALIARARMSERRLQAALRKRPALIVTMRKVLRDMEAAFAPAFDRLAEAAADALCGPAIRQIEALIAERDKTLVER